MKLTAEKFNEGMTVQQYMDQIKVNKQPILEIFGSVETPAEDRAFFDGLPEPLRLAVFTADWCGDAVSTSPAIFRLAEDTDGLDIRVFNRDEELELTNSFLPEHRHGTVPVFAVFDSQMHEVGRFIETARELVPVLDDMEKELASLAETTSDEAANRAAVRGSRMAYRVSHAREWGHTITREFAKVVKDGLALPLDQRPAEGGTEWPQQ